MPAPERTAYALRPEVTPESLANPFERFFRVRKLPLRETWAVVYDSYVWSLWQENVTLLQARGRFWLASGNGAELLAERGRPTTFVEDLPESPLRGRLKKLLGLRALRKVGRLELQEERWELRGLTGGREVVARLYLRRFPGEARLFVELQPLKEEEATEARVILEAISEPGAKPWVEMGLYLRGIEPEPYYLKPEIAFSGGEKTREVIGKIAVATLAVARRNEEGVREDWDTEFLHDYRVCLRRMRSLLGSIKGVYPEEPLQRWRAVLAEISQRTNRVRDLDVALLSRGEKEGLLPPALRPGLESFFAEVQEERDAAFTELLDYLRSEEYGKAIAGLGEELGVADWLSSTPAGEAPVLEQASLRIEHRLHQLLKRSKRLRKCSPDEEFHRVRILGKKLRYLLEFFGALYPEQVVAPLQKQLGKVQKVLGDFNDASVQQAHLLTMLEERREPLEPALALALGGLITALHLRHEGKRAKVRRALAEFSKADVTRRFRRLLRQSYDTTR